MSKANKTDVEQSKIPYIREYSPSRDENIAVLLLGCETPQSLPELINLFYYDAPQGIIYTIALPSVSVSQYNERTDTLKGHYDYGGSHGCVNAVKSLFETEIDRYARFQKAGISNMTDFFGGIPYNVDYEKTIGNEYLLEGEQLLDGRRTASLLFSESEKGYTDIALQSQLIVTMLENNFVSSNAISNKYEIFIDNIFFNCETNLNQYDFAKRQTGVLSKLKSNSIMIEEIQIIGGYNSDCSEFYISKESISKVKAIFE